MNTHKDAQSVLMNQMADGLEVRWTVLYCLYSWALVHLCFLHVVHGDDLRHTRISGILMESRHSVADGNDATHRSRHPGNPVAGVAGQVFVHPSHLCQIGESDQGRIAARLPSRQATRKAPEKAEVDRIKPLRKPLKHDGSRVLNLHLVKLCRLDGARVGDGALAAVVAAGAAGKRDP